MLKEILSRENSLVGKSTNDTDRGKVEQVKGVRFRSKTERSENLPKRGNSPGEGSTQNGKSQMRIT